MKEDFKKVLICLMITCMALAFSGCNRVKAAADVLMGKEEVPQATQEPVIEEEEPEEVVEEATPEPEEEPEAEPEKEIKATDYPVLGQTGIEDYDGFTYLYCEKIKTDSEKNEETGKMESFELEVFIPEDEYVYASRNYVSGEKLGIRYKITLEPSIRYNEDDYLTTENLDFYLDSLYDPFYRENYKDIDRSAASEVDKNSCTATVEYLRYDTYGEVYTPTFCTYYLTKLDYGCDVLVEFEVSGDSITGKTPELIDELQMFYPVTIDWDADRAAKKLETFLASGGDNSFTTGYLKFSLPDGWKQDRDMGDFDNDVYAPDGNSMVEGCFISMHQEYMGYEYAKDLGITSNGTALIKMVETMDLGEDYTDPQYYGETCLGHAVTVNKAIEIESGITVNAKLYLIFGESYLYTFSSCQMDDSAQDADAVLQDILKNGEVKDN